MRNIVNIVRSKDRVEELTINGIRIPSVKVVEIKGSNIISITTNSQTIIMLDKDIDEIHEIWL